MANNSETDSVSATSTSHDREFSALGQCLGVRTHRYRVISDTDTPLSKQDAKSFRAALKIKNTKIDTLKQENAKLRARLEQAGLSIEEEEWVVIDTDDKDKKKDMNKGKGKGNEIKDNKAGQQEEPKSAAEIETAKPTTPPATSKGHIEIDLAKDKTTHRGQRKEAPFYQSHEYKQRAAIQAEMVRACHEMILDQGQRKGT